MPAPLPVLPGNNVQLRAETIDVWRGDQRVIGGLSFDVNAGFALLVQGANGSGKSTLLRAIAGLLPLAAGKVEFTDPLGEFDTGEPGSWCHYLSHDNAMKPALSVGDNLTFWREFDSHQHLEVDEALEMVGLDHLADIPFAHLSKGQRRRVAIARLLVTYRPVWLLDEPSAGLDSASEEQLSALLRVHLEDGGLVLAATHTRMDIPNGRGLHLESPS